MGSVTGNIQKKFCLEKNHNCGRNRVLYNIFTLAAIVVKIVRALHVPTRQSCMLTGLKDRGNVASSTSST